MIEPLTEEGYEDQCCHMMEEMNQLSNKGLDFEQICNQAPMPSIDVQMKLMSKVCGGIPNYDGHLSGTDPTRVRWVVEAENRQLEDPVIVYLHGGAFCIGLTLPMVLLVRHIYDLVDNPRLSILILDYDLAYKGPNYKYPVQLTELTELVNALSCTCRNIYLMGDSAGGLLSANLFRHIVYPIPGVSKVLADVKPTGLILLSPWSSVNPDLREGSYVTNNGKDVPPKDWLSMSKVAFSTPDGFKRTEFNLAQDNIDWAAVLPQDQTKIFVSYGENELQPSDVIKFIDHAKLNDGNATIYVEPNGMHDTVSFEPKKSPVSVKLAGFLKQVL